MSQPDTPFLGDYSRRHRGSQIIDDDDDIDGMLVEETVELGHHPAGDLVQLDAVHTQIEVGPGHLEIIKQ